MSDLDLEVIDINHMSQLSTRHDADGESNALILSWLELVFMVTNNSLCFVRFYHFGLSLGFPRKASALIYLSTSM